jgi:nitrate reductase gamma subunit
MATVILWWSWLSVSVFVMCCVWRALKYARAPVHLRWDLYPVAHEPGRDHGGSYLEKKDWWDHPRKKSHWGEISAMAGEILLLKGVWENNRKLWWGSLPFHWGLYVLVLTTLGLVIVGLGVAPGPLLTLLAWLGLVGGTLTSVGALVLLAIRYTDGMFRPYTTTLDRLNLLLLVVLGGLSAAVAVMPAGMSKAGAAVGQILRLRAPELTPLLGIQMAVSALFLFYMPFTRMVHFFSKYFTYHQVRWDDRPVKAGSRLDRQLNEARNFGVAWSARHVGSGTWVDVVTTIPNDKDDKK